MTEDRGTGPTLEERAAELVRQMNPESGVVDLASWEGIRRRLPARLPTRRGGRRSFAVGARVPRLALWGLPALAACVLVAGFVWLKVGRSLGVAIEGGRLAEDGEVLPWGRDPSRLRFSDGTVVEVSPGSHARVAARTPRGARLVLQRGEIGLAVVHTGSASWQVDAGPYEVQVTGTKFNVRWDGTEERFSLRLTEGSVIVRGGLAGEGVRLKAGQRFESSEPAHWLEIADEALTTPAAARAEGPSAEAATGGASAMGASAGGASQPSTGKSAGVAGERAVDETDGTEVAAGVTKTDEPRPASSAKRLGIAHRRHVKPVRVALRGSEAGTSRAGLSPKASLVATPPATPGPPGLGVSASTASSPTATVGRGSVSVGPTSSPSVENVPRVVPAQPAAPPPRVDPSPPPRLMAGGAGCGEAAQFQFEGTTEQFATPGCCSLAFSALSVDKQHSFCGRSSLRADASFDLQGRPSFTGYPPRQTGEVKVRINPPQDFTQKTVSVRIFVDAPPGVRFAAVLYLVDNAVYVPGGYTESCSPGRWCTLRHTFGLYNPLSSGETVKVDRVSQLAFQIKSLGNMTAWSGRVYFDDIRWE